MLLVLDDRGTQQGAIVDDSAIQQRVARVITAMDAVTDGYGGDALLLNS